VDFQVVWTDPALADFEAAVRYLAERSPSAAESVRQSILEHVELLARLPFIGPAYEQDRTGRAREIVCGPYRIFYRVDEPNERVEILTVWHGSRSEPTLPL
jgi:plasmid stabilization system protein ParE